MPLHDVITPKEERLPRLGILRLGIKKKSSNGNEYPAEVDYFVTKDAPEVAEAYGQQPRQIMVYMPFSDVEGNFPAHHELWKSGGCACRGDGRHLKKFVKQGQGRVVQGGLVRIQFTEEDGTTYHPGQQARCPGLEHSYRRCGDCRPRATLFVMVRDPQRPMQLINDRLGYYQISTGSLINVQNITGQLNFALSMARSMGRTLQGIPMMLRRVKREISYVDGDGRQRKATKAFLELEFDSRWVQMANEAMAQALPSGSSAAALPAGDLFDEDEAFEEAEYIEEAGVQGYEESGPWYAADDFSIGAFYEWTRGLGLPDNTVRSLLKVEGYDITTTPYTNWEEARRILEEAAHG